MTGAALMADKARGASWNNSVRSIDWRTIFRLAIWGTATAAALGIAVLSAVSGTGSRRLIGAAAASGQGTAEMPVPLTPAELTARSIEAENVLRGLAEAVRTLNGDRDQLVTRLASIERNLDDITGSIKSQIASLSAAPARQDATLPPAREPQPEKSNAPEVPAPAPRVASAPAGATAIRSDPPPVEPTGIDLASTTEFGIDVGGAVNFSGLRILWNSAKVNNGALLDGLYPVIAVRENSKTHIPELRLVVGPLPNADTAARICANLAAARRYCQPVAFEGQRLPVADPVPEHKGTSAQDRKPTPAPERKPAPTP
jgi:hypothetical protein